MELSAVIDSRRSIRKYKDKEVTDEQIRKILHAGQMAPSAGNLQGREFIIIKDASTRAKISHAAMNQQFIADAPICIVVCANFTRSRSWYGRRGEMYAYQDSAASVMNMMLMATDLGLGTCWVGAFSDELIVELFQLPEGVVPVAILPVGYPDESPEAPARYWDRIEHWGKW